MLASVRLKNFKSFGDETLHLGQFSLIVGANASGKSNIRDVFRFIHGVGRGYTLAEIIGGKYGAGGQVEWSPIRGGGRELIRFGEGSFTVELAVRIERASYNYKIEVGISEKARGGYRVLKEELSRSGTPIFTSHPSGTDPVASQDDESHLLLRMAKSGDQRKYGQRLEVRFDQPALTQVPGFSRVIRIHKEYVSQVAEFLGSMRFLDLVPDSMRLPSFPGQNILGDNGENLPTVLQEICADEKKSSILVEWIRELTPIDVVGFQFPKDAVTGLVQLQLVQSGGQLVSAYSASDGTLRFLAMLAALLGTNPARVYFFEEIDNGIHPARLKLLVDLIEGQTALGRLQVVTSTHSPDLLSMIGASTFKYSSVVYRSSQNGASRLTRLSEINGLAELMEKQSLGRLHSTGWIEDALFLTDEEIAGE